MNRRSHDRRLRTTPGRRLEDAAAAARCPSCGSLELHVVRASDGVLEFECRLCRDFWLAAPTPRVL